MIRCNALVIVGIRSKPTASTDEAWREMMTRQVLTPYLGTPDDIASAALFLASDESRYVTGHLSQSTAAGAATCPAMQISCE